MLDKHSLGLGALVLLSTIRRFRTVSRLELLNNDDHVIGGVHDDVRVFCTL